MESVGGIPEQLGDCQLDRDRSCTLLSLRAPEGKTPTEWDHPGTLKGLVKLGHARQVPVKLKCPLMRKDTASCTVLLQEKSYELIQTLL